MNELVSNNKTGSSLVVVRREGDVDDPDVIACSCRCCCFCCRCSFSCCTSWFLRILFRRRFTSRYSSTNLARTLDPAIPSRVLLFVDMSGRPNRSCETCLGLLRLIVVVVVVLSSSEEPEEDTITLISRSTFWSCACKESTRSSNPFVPTEGTVENDDDDDKEEDESGLLLFFSLQVLPLLLFAATLAANESYRIFLRDGSGSSAGDVRVPVFCALNGAQFVPPLASIRQMPAVTTLLPTPAMVPNTAMLLQYLFLSFPSSKLVARLLFLWRVFVVVAAVFVLLAGDIRTLLFSRRFLCCDFDGCLCRVCASEQFDDSFVLLDALETSLFRSDPSSEELFLDTVRLLFRGLWLERERFEDSFVPLDVLENSLLRWDLSSIESE
mmetsp:Transcript_26163/g.56082  ORF Transcript_26163/g.56082 Transcript_26163/m.56082 type:complete len:383 (+) Transcript_26163:1606-2754(+)